MIKAGEAVDQQMELLRPHLSKGDIMIDAGNANFRDTIARFDRLKNTDLTFIGMGVSAARKVRGHGPSIMVGGTEDSWKACREGADLDCSQVQGRSLCRLARQ